MFRSTLDDIELVENGYNSCFPLALNVLIGQFFIRSLWQFFQLQAYMSYKTPDAELQDFISQRGFDIILDKAFIPVIQNDLKYWLAIEEGMTLEQQLVACMYSSSLHFNLVMSIFCKTTHVLLKLNLFPYTDVAHACHVISARWCFPMREWEIANNDGVWTSSRRVMQEGVEQD